MRPGTAARRLGLALPGSPLERYDRVPLPDNNDRYLRLTIDGDDAAGLVVQDATAPAETRRRRKGVALAAGVAGTEAPEGRESQLVLSLGARYQPFIALALEVDSRTFFRGAVLEAQGPGASWTPLTEAAVYRLERDGATEAWPRYRALAGVVAALLVAILLALGRQVRRTT